MKIIQTESLTPSRYTFLMQEFDVRNGIDTMVTYEVLEALLPQLTATTAATYAFSRDLQGPILEMNMRGLLVDEGRRQEVLRECREGVVRLTDNLNRIIREGIGWQFEISKNRKYSWPSDDQLKTLFFKVLGIPEIKKRNAQGDHVLTVDHDALEKLEGYFYAETIVRHILSLRELGKKISFLSTSIDSDGRLRTSFNIAGTTTGRLASSFSDFGTGTNLQNVENRLRSVFVADPGYKFCNIDLEQSDARAVGAIHWNLFRDSCFLDACESGDLHTAVARSGFPQIQWTGERGPDRALADAKFCREFSYRDAAKRLGHGTNYQGQPDKMARATHIPLANIVAFQRAYLAQFPSFPLWWEWVERQVRDVRRIVSLTGRQRHFFGHPRDPETIRKAVAYEPQNITADVIDRGLLAVWRANFCQLLLQVHDSILFQFPADREAEIVPRALALVQQTFHLKDGRDFMIPAEAKTGFNWADFRKDNPDPDALQKWPNNVGPRRQRNPKSYAETL